MVHMNTFSERLLQSMRYAGYAGHGSATRLARELKVTPKAVAKWLHGESMPTFKRIADIAVILRVDPEWLLWGYDGAKGATANSTPVQGGGISATQLSKAGGEALPQETPEYEHPDLIPISSWDDETPLDDDEVEIPFLREVELSAGSGRTVIQESTRAKLRFGKLTLRKHSVQFDQAVCVPVHGNSMEPVLPNGSTVAINKGATTIIDGKMYALSHAGQLRVKTLYRLPGGGIRLRSFNRDEHPDEEYTVEEMRENEIRILGRVFWSAAFH